MFVCLNDSSGGGSVAGRDFALRDCDPSCFAAGVKDEPSAGPWIEGTDMPVDFLGRSLPVDLPVALADFTGVRGLGIGLGNRAEQAIVDAVYHVAHGVGCELRQLFLQTGGRFRPGQFQFTVVEHWAGIKSRHDTHERYTGLFLAPEDGPLNGRCATIPG